MSLTKPTKYKQFNEVLQVKVSKVAYLLNDLSNPQARRLLKEVN